METKKAFNYLDFLFENAEENNRLIRKELKKAGLDTNKFQSELLKMIKQKEIDLKVEEGEKLKELYNKIKDKIAEKRLKQSKINENKVIELQPEIQMAFRKLQDNLTIEEIDNIIEDNFLLDELVRELGKTEDR